VIDGTHNSIFGIGSDGVYSGTQNLLIENNRILNSDANGIQVGNIWAVPNGVTIRNNIIYKSAASGISLTGATAGVINQDIKIYNNTINANNQGIMIGVSNNVVVKNNLVFGNQTSNIDYWSSTNIIRDYNLYSPAAGSAGEGSHSLIVQDPTVLTTFDVNGDFQLKTNSPAINAGTDLSGTGFSDDFSGALRPQGSAWDIGAYEYGSSGSVAQPHPADINTQDWKMSLNEATQYGFCWKSAPAIPTGCPNPAADINNAARAGTLWSSTSDGRYTYDSRYQCPLCWVPAP
jgi:hypothetical protein